MKRREFITLFGGAAMAWPIAARAQHTDRMRRIGLLTANPERDREQRSWIMAFAQRLQELGWTDGRNVRIDYRFGAPDAMQRLANELLELQPDAIVTAGSPAAVELRQRTRTVPIIFVQVGDPIGMGLVESLAHPEGNVTGFAQFEPAIAGKWLQILKELSPTVTRVAVIVHPENPSWKLYWKTIEAAAPSLGVQLTSAPAHDAAEIEHAMNAFVHDPNGGLIVTNSAMTTFHREAIVALAARHRVPAVYPFRYFAVAGGLASYGIDPADPYREAASYVDRILRGAKPADLPVQQPTKFEFVINLKTAKALGLTIPLTLLGRADEVIE